MNWFKSPLDPVDRDQQLPFAIIAAVAGAVGLGLAIYFATNQTGRGRVFIPLITGGTGAYSLVIARRLYTGRTPHKSGTLVSPWLTLAIGALFLGTGVATVAVWMIVPGAIGIYFALRQLYPNVFGDGA